MNILGVGPLEFVLVLVIMLLVLGPRDMVATGQKIGKWIRKLITSPTWTSIMNTSREIREIPTKLVRDAGIDESIAELKKSAQEISQISQKIEGDLLETGRLAEKEISAIPPSLQPTSPTQEPPAPDIKAADSATSPYPGYETNVLDETGEQADLTSAEGRYPVS
jgi:sec-independent protein translocase protein TatB